MPPLPHPEVADDGLLYIRVTSDEPSGIIPQLNLPDDDQYNQIQEHFDRSQYSKLPTQSIDSASSQSTLSLESQTLKSTSSWIERKWGFVVTLCVFILMFFGFGFLCCYTLLFVHLQAEFRSTATETGWVGSIAVGLTHMATPLANYLIFKLQSTRLVVFIGVLMCSMGLALSSIVPQIYYLYGTIGVMVGIGVNFMQHSGTVLLVQYFPGKDCTRYVSLATLGTPTGLLVFGQVMERAIEALGWRATLRYLAVLFFVVCSIASLPLVPVPNSGSPVGEEDGDESAEASEEKQSCMEKGALKKKEEERSRKASQISTVSTIKTFKSFAMLTAAWITCSAFFLSSLAQTFHFVNFVGHLYTMGLAEHASVILMALAAGEMAGKFALGVFGHKFTRPKVYLLALSNVGVGLLTLSIAWVANPIAVIAITGVAGVVRAGYQVLGVPVVVEIFGVSRIYDAAAGMLLSMGVGFSLGSVVMGISYDYTGSYVISIILAAGLFCTSGLLFILVDVRHKCTRAGREDLRQTELEIVHVVEPTPQQLIPWPSVMHLDHADVEGGLNRSDFHGSTYIVHVGDGVTVVDVDQPTSV